MKRSILFIAKIFLCLNLANVSRCYDASNKIGSIQTIPEFEYLGCFADKREHRDIAEKDFSFITKYNKSKPTVELCAGLCASEGFKIAAVQAYDECYCGNTYGRYNSTSNAKCFFHCGGKYSCGGYNANSVYKILSEPAAIVKETARPVVKKVELNPCASSPCLNSGVCVTETDETTNEIGYKCHCKNKIDSGVFCEERNFCAKTPCYNGGTCTNTFNGFKCACSSAWRGFNCRYRNNNPNPLPDSATTPALSFQQSVVTTAPQNFYSKSKITFPKYVSSDCFSFGRKCQNGGVCAKKGYIYACQCVSGYTGTTCEIPPVDACTKLNLCQNNGKCSSSSSDAYECECEGNYEGKQCEILKPACSGIVCEHDGVCVNNATSYDYYCLCKGNRSGKNCDECMPNFIGEECDMCTDGFTGTKCAQKSSPFCSPNPCKNGLCLWDSTGFRCVCSEGWTGKNCSEKNCVLSPCLNEGACKGIFDSTQSQMDYKCVCPDGFSGRQCEQAIDPCLSSPCNSDEECINSASSKEFTCVPSTNLCQRLKPCNNNSECVYSKELNTFDCRCLNGASECGSDSDKDFKKTEVIRNEWFLNSNETDGNQTRIFSTDTEIDIPKVGFNYDNLYWILPLCLVVFVVVFFLAIVIYFGLKARNKTAKFSKKANNIRNIHYVNDTMSYDENLKPIPNISSTSMSYSDKNSEKEFADAYGRV